MMNKLTKARISQYCNVTNIVDKKSYHICLYAGAKSFPDPQIKSSAGGIRMDFFFSSQYISNLCPDLYLLGQQDGNPIQICTNEMFIHNTYIYIYMIYHISGKIRNIYANSTNSKYSQNRPIPIPQKYFSLSVFDQQYTVS